MSRARQGRFARLLSVVASVALVGPILALSSPVLAYAEEPDPTPPAVVETTAVPAAETESEPAAPASEPGAASSAVAPFAADGTVSGQVLD